MTITRLEAAMRERLGLDPAADRADFEAARAARLVAAVGAARVRSPFYRARTDWPEAEITGPDDLARLPFTSAADIVRADPPLVAVSGGDVDRVVTLPTSGTSGPAKRLHFSSSDIVATIEFFRLGMSIFTRPGDRVSIAFPSDRRGGVSDGIAEAMQRLGAVPFQIPSEASPEVIAAFLRLEKPDVITGPPVRLLATARVSTRDGGVRPSPRAVLVSSDHAAPALKRAIAAAWGCEVYDHWGMTETGFGGAVECPAHDGMHLREGDLFLEIVDPETGAAVAEGEEGEIVVTTLHPRATPLVRYRTGDRGRLSTAQCACGGWSTRLLGLSGRIADDAVLPGGGHLSLPMLDEALFAIDDVCDFEARLVLGAAARLSIRVAAPRGRRRPELVEAVEAALADVPALAGPLAGGTLGLDVSLAEASILPRTGKRRLLTECATCSPSG